MSDEKIVEIAALLTHSFFLNEFCIAKSLDPKKNINPNSDEVVQQVFEEYIKDILKDPLKTLNK